MFELVSVAKFLDQSLMLREWMKDIKERGSVY